MIRFIFLNILVGLITMFFCLWALLVSFFDKDGELVHAYSASPWGKLVLWVCGVRVTVIEKETIDPGLPRIYASNHQSAFDIFTLLAHLEVHFKFILKQELMKVPLLGMAMRRAKYIEINRSDPREAIKSINRAAERIKNGASVLIYPEGTRSNDGRLQPLKKGGFHMALRSGCSIVPITIIDSYKIMPKGSLRINRGDIKMIIGKPVSPEGYNKHNLDDLVEKVRNRMIDQAEGAVKRTEDPD